MANPRKPPGKKRDKRISLSLAPPRYDLVTRLAKTQRKSRAGVLAELLEEVAPVLERLVVVAEAAALANTAAKEGLRSSMEKAEQQLVPHAAHALNQYDLFLAELQRNARTTEGGEEAASAAPAPAPRTRHVSKKHGRRKLVGARKRGRKR